MTEPAPASAPPATGTQTPQTTAPAGTSGATVLLLRHARSTANTAGILAGRTPGVHLDDHGRGQADGVAGRLADLPVSRIVSSPLDRCRQTVGPLAERLGLTVDVDERLAEVDYGDWSGRALKDLASEPLWRVVQAHPSAAGFPGGETMAGMSARAVAAVRDAVAAAAVPHPAPPTDGAKAPAPAAPPIVLVCSHGDVLKAILADALGLHLDQFQRIVVAPASLSVIRYTDLRPFVERVNDTGDLSGLKPAPPAADDPAPAAGSDSDAVPGGTTR